MPVAGVPGRECPNDTRKFQTGSDCRIVGNIRVVIIDDELYCDVRPNTNQTSTASRINTESGPVRPRPGWGDAPTGWTESRSAERRGSGEKVLIFYFESMPSCASGRASHARDRKGLRRMTGRQSVPESSQSHSASGAHKLPGGSCKREGMGCKGGVMGWADFPGTIAAAR